MEITKENIHELIGEGKLRFGETMLEFANRQNFQAKKTLVLWGFNASSQYCFEASGSTRYVYARFPVPNPALGLKDGDPVICLNGASNIMEHRIVKKWKPKFPEIVIIYPDGLNRWTDVRNYYQRCSPGYWRIPTPDELAEQGFPMDYYTKRSRQNDQI
jgi:hypothetical protein